MGLRLVFAFILTFAALAPATAQDAPRELHIVAVHHGNIRTGDRIHGPEVHVNLARPGTSVILALNTRTPTRFLIAMGEDTTLENVYLFGKIADQSEVIVNGAKQATTYLPQIAEFDHDAGFTFRRSLRELTALTDTDRATSVTVKLHRLDGPIGVTAAMDAPRFQRDYIDEFVNTDRMTPALTAILQGTPPDPMVTFTENGFVLTESGVKQAFPITLDVPPVVGPVAAAYDADRNLIYGLSTGGEGFIYRYDIAARQWSALDSLRNQYAHGMVFDADRNRLLLSVRPRQRNAGNMMEWSEATGLRPFQFGLLMGDFPGLIDLIEPDKSSRSGQRPVLVPLAIEGDLLLMRALPRNGSRERFASPPYSRTYLINVETSETTLVGYTGE